MGLDMYLYRKTYIQNWNEEREFKVKLTYNGKEIKLDNPSSISENVGYWRKANQIHKWFVDNVQDGTDDCGTYDVSKKQLQDLLGLCKQVKNIAVCVATKVHTGTTYSNGEISESYEDGYIIENADEVAELLPTESGFFFGDTSYNNFYMDDIDNTIEILERIFEHETPDGISQWYEYRSSW